MNHKVLRRALDLCWATLCVYFILKAFGATWFEAIPGTDFFDTHLWATAILGTLTSYVLFTIYYMVICAKKHLDLWVHIALLPYFAAMTCLKVYLVPVQWHMALDMLSNFVIPFLLVFRYYGKRTAENSRVYFRPFIAFALNYGFQAISTTARSIGVQVVITSVFAQLLLSLDVLIMLVLYWLYSLLYQGGEKE